MSADSDSATLASRCSKRTARQLPRCGAVARAKSIYCDSSSFGPALFEIWWPDIYLGGPYGPVKDKMYWPELVRRSEKCAGPAGQCLCRGLRGDQIEVFRILNGYENIDSNIFFEIKENKITRGPTSRW